MVDPAPACRKNIIMHISNKTLLLEAKDLQFTLGEQQIIRDISVSLHQHELIAIIGPNGAGKSTLMKLLTGFSQPTSGQCLLDNKPLTQWDNRSLALKRAVMKQQSQLNFPFSVGDVITMGRSPHGSAYLEQALLAVLTQTDSLHLRHRDYRQLSGGEQQRVQLARVLAQLWQPNPTPSCLFLDEPTSALDLYHQQHSLRLLHRLSREQPLGICCILHDLNLTALYADRVYLIHQGQLVATGTPTEVLTETQLNRWYKADLGVFPHPESAVPQIYLRQ